MTTTPESPTVDQLMVEYQNLKTQADQIRQRMDDLKTVIATHLPEGGKVAGHTVAVSQGRVSWAKVAKDFPAETYPQLYSTQFDQKEAAKHIAPAVLDPYRGEATVSIR